MKEDNQLQVGFGEVEITPAPPPENPEAFKVFDPLGFRAIVFKCGDQNLALLTGDFFSFEGHMLELVRSHLDDVGWLESSHILASVSHCGGVPILFPSYVNQPCSHLRTFGQEAHYAEAAAQAIRAAINDLRPARIGLGQAAAPNLNYNRRSYDRDGKLIMSNFMLPYPRPELAYGPIDPHVYVIRVDEEPTTPTVATKLRAAVVAFGCHALCNNDKQGHISADYPGVARQVVMGACNVPVAFIPGTIGNAVPMDRGGDAYQRIGEAVGKTALEALEKTHTSSKAGLQIRQKTIRVPCLEKGDAEVAEAVLAEGSPGSDGNLRFNLYGARRTAALLEMDYTITALRIGQGLLLHLPGEVFVETGGAIRESSSFHPLVIISGPTADVGYLCPAQAHAEGGMEPQFAALSGEAEALIRHTAIELINENWQEQWELPQSSSVSDFSCV